MKKILLIALAAVSLLACTGKKAAQADDAITAEYEQLTAQLEDLFNDEEIEEAVAMARLDSILNRYLELAEEAPETDMCYEILGNTYYFYTTEQKARLFATLNTDTLEARGMGRYARAFEAEKTTTVGCPFVDFSAPTPDSDSLSLSEVVDGEHWVLVDFWASWCGPCRASMPAMIALYEELNGALRILGVSLDNEQKDWTGAIERLGLPWQHVSDLKGWQCGPAQLYGVSAIPATVLIAPDGTIYGRNLEAEEIRAAVGK